MPFRILSIDGGGLRGIVPLIILEQILKITGKNSISESFDLIAGTSTGGIIACALSYKENGVNKYNLSEIREIYEKNGGVIFPTKNLNFGGFFGPKYSAGGLETTLEQYFKEATLQDCKTPILVSAYDVNNYNGFYYTSRFVNPTSIGNMGNAQFKLTDICRSTSAAPTYFSSHSFSFLNHETQSQASFNLIDGGVFVNNPTLAALTEVLEHSNDPLYTKLQVEKINLSDIYIVSLGTGIGAKTITKSQGAGWGKIKWANKMFDIMMQGNSQSVHNQVKTILAPKKYLRLNIMLDEGTLEMDDSSQKTRDSIIKKINKDIVNNAVSLNNISQFVMNAGL